MRTIPTTPFQDQRPGTSGLRKKTSQFRQPRYVENFVQSIFDVLPERAGILSTPAMSAVIRKRGAMGGLILSASHNPGGPSGDFGIKYNGTNGGPAPESLTEKIYRRTLEIDRYLTVDHADVDLDREGTVEIGGTKGVGFDPLKDYTELMQSLFDFDALRAYLAGGFRMLFDAMH